MKPSDDNDGRPFSIPHLSFLPADPADLECLQPRGADVRTVSSCLGASQGPHRHGRTDCSRIPALGAMGSQAIRIALQRDRRILCKYEVSGGRVQEEAGIWETEIRLHHFLKYRQKPLAIRGIG